MKNILTVLYLLLTTLVFSQEEPSCDDTLDIFNELIAQHENLLTEYCLQLDNNSSLNANTSIENIVKNKANFVGSYLNFFLNNRETRHITQNLAKREKTIRRCLKDELFKHEVKSNFLMAKDNVKDNVSNRFDQIIEYLFDVLLKKIKVN